MAEAACGASFGKESSDGEVIIGQVRVNSFDRHRPTERNLFRAIDAPHAADANKMRDAVAPRKSYTNEWVFTAARHGRQLSATRYAIAMRVGALVGAARAADHPAYIRLQLYDGKVPLLLCLD